MKIVVCLRHLVAGVVIALATLSGIAGVAVAQNAANTPQAPQSKTMDIATTYNARASNEVSPTISFDAVKSITQGAIRELVGEQLGNISQSEIQSKLEGSSEKLMAGQVVSFGATVAGLAAHSVTEQHAMHVSVKYDARPIGGILTVRAELVPVFSGIGSASRPTALKTMSQAVDRLDEQMVGAVVSDLIHSLGSEYAAK